jgi:hypothetical protein
MHIEIEEAHSKLDDIHEKIQADELREALFAVRKFINIMTAMENSIKLNMKIRKYSPAELEEEGE